MMTPARKQCSPHCRAQDFWPPDCPWPCGITRVTVSRPRRRPWPFWLVYVMDGSTVVRRVRGLTRRGTVRRAEDAAWVVNDHRDQVAMGYLPSQCRERDGVGLQCHLTAGHVGHHCASCPDRSS